MTTTDQPLPGGDRQRLLLSCKALIFKWTSVHFKGYLEKLDQQLQRMAEKAGSNQDQHRLLQSRNELQQRRTLERQLLVHMRDAFDAFLNREETAADIAQADVELKLVDNDELELSIAIATMTRRANADFAEALYALNQRLSVLGGGYKISDRGNPIAPPVFTEGLQDAFAPLTLDTQSKLVAYKVYDGAVMAKLDKLYHLLNHHLKTQGVLPHLRYQIRKDEVAPLPKEFATQNSVESITKQTDLMKLVQQLQTSLGPMPPPVGIARPAPYIVSHLQPLQQRSGQVLAAALSQAAVLESDYATLPQQIHQQTRDAVNADVIEIVGLLFEYMLNDEQLPDSVKALLSYLHTPFLKVALLDQHFFNHPQHPSRQLLNSLVAAGERWVEPEGKYKNDVYQQIKAVVQRILDEFESDIRLFSQLTFDFNHYLRQHSRRVQLAEQRALQAARGEDTLKEIRQRVESYLQQKLQGLTVPDKVRTLLFEPWANVLAFNLLRFGSASPQWQAAAQVVDDILNYLFPPHRQTADTSSQQAQQHDWQLRDALDEKLSAGFQTVGYDIDSGSRLLAALHDAHRENLSQPPPATPAIKAADIDTPVGAAAQPPDSIIEQLSKLEFGTWFLFLANRPRKEQWEAKLAWSNSRTQHYMFVNRLGQQVAVKSGPDLAADIRAGNTRILQPKVHVPFFERALERIAEQLRRSPRSLK
jgi:uncharacterized protein DUF1631